MPFEEAAVFRVSYATAYYALAQRARLMAGETVLVLGAAGAIGLAAVQIAKALGACVIASASSEAKRRLALASGADFAVESGTSDWPEHDRKFTGGIGANIVVDPVDPVGGASTEPAFRCVA
jgi:NADPH2:quinone reductase